MPRSAPGGAASFDKWSLRAWCLPRSAAAPASFSEHGRPVCSRRCACRVTSPSDSTSELDGRVLAYALTVAVVTDWSLVWFRPFGHQVQIWTARFANHDTVHRAPIVRGSVASSWWRKSLCVLCFSPWPGCSCGACSKLSVRISAFGRGRPQHSHGCRATWLHGGTRAGLFRRSRPSEYASIPGVQNVSFAFTIPMGYVRVSTAVEAEGQPVDSDSRVSAGKNMVSSEYFQTMGIPIVRGRSFSVPTTNSRAQWRS